MLRHVLALFLVQHKEDGFAAIFHQHPVKCDSGVQHCTARVVLRVHRRVRDGGEHLLQFPALINRNSDLRQRAHCHQAHPIVLRAFFHQHSATGDQPVDGL
ncbi:hypothetical protein D3C72_1371900 [compost metagenome]